MIESTLDSAKLSAQLEKQTEVRSLQFSGISPWFLMKRPSSPRKIVTPTCRNSLHSSKPTKVGTTLSGKVHIVIRRIRVARRPLRRPQIPPSIDLRPKGQRRKRGGHQLSSGQDKARWEGLFGNHLRAAHHIGQSSAPADQLLQRV